MDDYKDFERELEENIDAEYMRIFDKYNQLMNVLENWSGWTLEDGNTDIAGDLAESELEENYLMHDLSYENDKSGGILTLELLPNEENAIEGKYGTQESLITYDEDELNRLFTDQMSLSDSESIIEIKVSKDYQLKDVVKTLEALTEISEEKIQSAQGVDLEP